MRSTTLGQYLITGELGLGGMGAVYRAEHALLGRAAAIKLLRPELSKDQDIVLRFFNEARAAAAIQHPGIVEIYDFGWHSDGSAYLVMEYLHGESLAARLARGRMTASGAIMVVRQIAGALAAAHRIGIVHRDLKPENVFLVPDPEVVGGERIKLLDFGVAKLVAEADPGRVTRPGMVLGTPRYMAPEQCRGEHIDHRADLYSLGCILFELCTGRPPFTGNGVREVLFAQVYEAAPPISSLAPEVAPVMDLLAQQLLTKDRERRTQHAEAVIEAIDTATGRVLGSSEVVVAQVELASGGRPLPTLPAPAAGATTRSRGARGLRRAIIIGLGLGIGAGISVAGLRAVSSRAGGRPVRASEDAPSITRGHDPALRVPDGGLLDEQRPDLAARAAGTTEARSPPSPDSAPTEKAPTKPARRDDSTLRAGPPSSLRGAAPPADASSTPALDTAAALAELYVETGQRLKALGDSQGTDATSDLWAQFTRIRIDDVIADPAKRSETAALLKHLQDAISARSR